MQHRALSMLVDIDKVNHCVLEEWAWLLLFSSAAPNAPGGRPKRDCMR
jgi:hypothetical protein